MGCKRQSASTYENTTISGTQGALNPYRYSTKEFENASGLYDYGFRLYVPSLGRWLNRDPLLENGGRNLYAFVNNHPIGRVDRLGLQMALSPVPAADDENEDEDYWEEWRRETGEAMPDYQDEKFPWLAMDDEGNVVVVGEMSYEERFGVFKDRQDVHKRF